ncbi:MAG: hypothetical protein JW888_08345 [Pirellulales bacterium]|nr:hypothetical protein [Pirellulales bacterium]
MKHLIRAVLAVACLWFCGEPAAAAPYRFQVPKADMRVLVRPDGAVRVVYDLVFKNEPGAHPIDIVDIGTFHEGYHLGNVRASCDGFNLSDIRKSTEIDTGFEVHMERATIMPGRSATLHVEYTMPQMVYQDTTREDYASLQVSPTWFGSEYVVGQTELKVVVQLPKGVKPGEVFWQDVKFDQKAADGDTTVVGWYRPHFRLDHQERFSVSFPRGNIPVVRMTKLGLLLKWFRESTQARVVVGLLVVGLWTLAFFRFTGGTGFSVYVVLTGLMVWAFVAVPEVELAAVPIAGALVFWNEWALSRRKAHYMPPIAQVEGGGIKRGLTAPEAAMLLELPLSKVLTLVIFGMLKKGLLRQIEADPLKVAVNEPFLVDMKTLPTTAVERAELYRRVAHKTGIAVHKYEHPFLYLIQRNPSKPLKDINFSAPLKQLITRLVGRMKGFDLSDTKDYYQSIIRRALEQAKSIGDVPMREKVIDRNFEWILMDHDYPTVFAGHTPYRPIWTRGSSYAGMGGGTATSAAPSVGGATSFGDVARSFAGWTENTMGSMASAISPGSLNLAKPSGGFLDLSGADSLTGEMLSALTEGVGSGRGGGGFSGCACAGCACACACAGGGR